MSLKSLVGQVGIALRMRRVMGEVEKVEKTGFNWKITVWKGVKTLGLVITSACVPVVAEQLGKQEMVQTILEQAGTPVGLSVAISALVASVVKMFINWYTHRDGPK